MSSNLESLINELLSPINNIRKSAENKFETLFKSMNLEDLDGLLNQLIQVKKAHIKSYICVIIKKFIEEKVNISNIQSFFNYLLKNKIKFIDILLSNESSILIIKNIIICLFSFGYIKSEESYYNKYLNILYEFFSYLVQCYLNKKEKNDLNEIIRCLIVCEKFIKKMESEKINQTLDDFIKKFYNIIFEDYKTFISNIINGNINDIIYLQIIYYFLKLLSHSYIFFADSYNDTILNNTYDLNVFILNKLVSNEIKKDNMQLSKLIFDIIFKSNKIIIEYLRYDYNLSIQILEKIANVFYIYVKEEHIFNYINNILKNSDDIEENMEFKFLSDIITVFYELLTLITDNSRFGNNFANKGIDISNYFKTKFWNKEKIKSLLLFIIKNYFMFKPKEIQTGLNEPEEFYLNFYNSDSYYNDIKGTAGKICRIIYNIYGNEINDIYSSLEYELYNLTGTEYNLLNKGEHLNDNQINLRLALLYYYFYTDNYFSSDDLDKQKWLEQILLTQIDPNIIKRKNEIFSTFLTLYVLTKFNSYVCDDNTKYIIFLKIINLFLCKDFDNLLLNISCIDYLYDYLGEKKDTNINIPKDIINLYISKICKILAKVNSPDIHNKIIQTTNILLNKLEDNNSTINFPEIFPVLQNLWNSNSNVISKKQNDANKLILMKSNLLKLIGIFVKKFGFFISMENMNTNNQNNINQQNFYDNYFNFIYQIIGFSINIKSPVSEFLCKDCFNLIIFIQDDFCKVSPLSTITNMKDLKSEINSFQYFPYFLKTYDYLDILLSNLSDSNQHFILQFGAIEQFISFSFENQISQKLENINFIDKIIYIFNFFLNNYVNQYHFYIFSIIEYIYYIIMSYSKISENNKKILNDYIYQLIQNKLGDNNFENIINTIINKTDESNINSNIFTESEINTFNIYIGIIQLMNRYIFINAFYYKNSNNDINIFLAKKIIQLSKFFINYNKKINFSQRTMLRNCVFNLKHLINENVDKNINITLNDIYNQVTENQFTPEKISNINHWLYFFNRIYNSRNFKGITEEFGLRTTWLNLFEKDVQLIDSIKKDYNIKFLMLASDIMFVNEKQN